MKKYNKDQKIFQNSLILSPIFIFAYLKTITPYLLEKYLTHIDIIMSRRGYKIIIIFQHFLAHYFNFRLIGTYFLSDLILPRAWRAEIYLDSDFLYKL
jgi:hypothetical protein